MIPSIFLFFETIAASFYPKKRKHEENACLVNPVSYAVIIPAHNEEIVLPQTLSALLGQLKDPEKVLVVADNCTDQTAMLAKTFGVMVVERFDQQLKGKGYALDFGIKYLQQSQLPEVVFVLDADCELVKGNFDTIACKVKELQRPIQVTYLCSPKDSDDMRLQIASLAMLFKNYIRPLGLKMMNRSCLLGGTGMAFPHDIVNQLNFATGNIVEDTQLSLECLRIGRGPYFYENAIVESNFPVRRKAEKTQRTRWEHGHLNTIVSEVPSLVIDALKGRNADLLFLAFEIGVPPLSLLVIIQTIMSLIFICVSVVAGMVSMMIISCLPIVVLAGTVLLGWIVFGRNILPLKYIVIIPWYIVRKIPLYVKFLIRPETKWIRTSRD